MGRSTSPCNDMVKWQDRIILVLAYANTYGGMGMYENRKWIPLYSSQEATCKMQETFRNDTRRTAY